MAIFSDFNTSLAKHPIKGDLAIKTDVDAVKQSIKNLVLTNKMERPFQPTLGCDIRKSLFENISPTTIVLAKQTIIETLERHEPRCNIINIKASSDEDSNALFITIVFSVINNADTQELNLVLERVR